MLGAFLDGSPHFTVIDVAKGSPADGKILKDDVVMSVNGKLLDGFPIKQYPNQWYSKKGSRYALGSAITEAEASDGALAFGIRRSSGTRTVIVKIPVLGAYSQTWPINCKKSEAIVRSIAEPPTARPTETRKSRLAIRVVRNFIRLWTL